jgi:hypothetical protein
MNDDIFNRIAEFRAQNPPKMPEMPQMYKGVRVRDENKRYTKEYCDIKKEEYFEKRSEMMAEYETLKRIAELRLPGRIREHKKAVQEKKEEIKMWQLTNDHWFNGGVF